MAAADQIYVDPSALSRLYLHQHGSREMASWRFRTKGALPVTHHGRMEIVNGIALAGFRKEITNEQAIQAWASLDEDFAAGHLLQVNILWRAALNRAGELSRAHTPTVGTRSLDILHVSCALELGMRYFLTLDERQERLARLAGLKVIQLTQ